VATATPALLTRFHTGAKPGRQAIYEALASRVEKEKPFQTAGLKGLVQLAEREGKERSLLFSASISGNPVFIGFPNSKI
jgi:hypothetical protein